MQIKSCFPLAMIAVAVLSACGTAAVKSNPSLAAAHSSYDYAQSNPQITNLAALEMKEASDTLTKADDAMSKGQSTAAIDHLAYIASQQVGIAQETAKRKNAELAVTNAAAKRNEIRLEARTEEVETARQETNIAKRKTDTARQEANAARQEASVAKDEAIVARQEADISSQQELSANQDKEMAILIANQQAADLEAADAKAQIDQETIAKQQVQLQELSAKKTERGMVITLGDVLFRTDKAQLESGGVHNIQKLADFLNHYPQHKVLIEGYTDSTGSNSHNLALSESRANAVKTALTGRGINADRIAVRGYGEEYPVASNATAATRQLNRRVEIILSDHGGNIIQR